MSKKSSISYEIKVQAVRRCLRHESNPTHEAKQLGVHPNTVSDWIRKYQADGLEGLKKSKGWKVYSKELRQAAIQDAISGNYSLRSITKKYNISGESVLEGWISKYTKGKTTRKRIRSQHMNKGRKTTYEERIEIVQYTLAHDLNYQKAIDKYGISYQQVYAWVRKYKAEGQEALQDHRGRKKTLEELDEQERLKLRIKELEARNEYLEMENALAKKLAEIRRRTTP